MALSTTTQQSPAPGGDDSQESLGTLIQDAGMSLDGDQLRQLAMYRELLFTSNQTTNLTAVRDLAGIERRLILESLRLVAPLRDLHGVDSSSRRSLIDLGTGGGLPGLVLAIVCPEFSVFLLDATGKKVAFLDHVAQALGLTNTTTIHARAEEIGHQPRYRNAFDVVSARAVATLPALLELGLPLLRTGGHLLLPKGTMIDDELAAAHRAATILGGEIVSADLLPDAGSTVETRLVIARKRSPTPAAYPRRTGIPSKSPLGVDVPGNGLGRRGRDPS
ncbi:MAG: 16S rRNA (guanine(527)-N(7))-methyltransferase RsmG [Chloroflexia bacterium]|nr:16S rRNA (guanine(527)-N(7))-methyltransferase RsmG [Chloroflexia bacterium]